MNATTIVARRDSLARMPAESRAHLAMAFALHEVLDSPETEEAGAEDAERAIGACGHLEALGYAVVPAALLQRVRVMLHSEHGVAAMIAGHEVPDLEPWPELDAVVAALDEALPEWREPIPAEPSAA